MAHNSLVKAATTFGKRVYVYAGTPSAISMLDLGLGGEKFVATLLLGSSTWSPIEMRAAVSKLVREGAVYLLFHGSRASEAEAVADSWLSSADGVHFDVPVICTVSVDTIPLGELVEQATTSSWPAEGHIEMWTTTIFFCLDDSSVVEKLTELLA